MCRCMCRRGRVAAKCMGKVGSAHFNKCSHNMKSSPLLFCNSPPAYAQRHSSLFSSFLFFPTSFHAKALPLQAQAPTTSPRHQYIFLHLHSSLISFAKQNFPYQTCLYFSHMPYFPPRKPKFPRHPLFCPCIWLLHVPFCTCTYTSTLVYVHDLHANTSFMYSSLPYTILPTSHTRQPSTPPTSHGKAPPLVHTLRPSKAQTLAAPILPHAHTYTLKFIHSHSKTRTHITSIHVHPPLLS